MTSGTLKAIAAAALIGATLCMPAPAMAGRGDALGAGLLGFGVGAIIGSTLAPREVYVVPPPPPPPAYYYGPAAYGPPPWTPDWYGYCEAHYVSFDPATGYFMGYDGYPHFCR